MAIYHVRGISHNIIYPVYTEKGGKKQHWETYATELEAKQRKVFIDYLQKNRLYSELAKAANEYKKKKTIERAIAEQFDTKGSVAEPPTNPNDDNMSKTYAVFVEKWLPYHARKENFSPNSYDSYQQNLRNHILPYFGNRVMSKITSEDIDDFLDSLSKKPCGGAKSYGKLPKEVPTLSTGTIKKCYTILTPGF